MNNNGLNVTAFFILTWTPEVQLWDVWVCRWVQICTGSEDPAPQAQFAFLAPGAEQPPGFNSCLPGLGSLEVGMLLGVLQGNGCTECSGKPDQEFA